MQELFGDWCSLIFQVSKNMSRVFVKKKKLKISAGEIVLENDVKTLVFEKKKKTKTLWNTMMNEFCFFDLFGKQIKKHEPFLFF